jgi:two-component system cell cycle response regulator DivK
MAARRVLLVEDFENTRELYTLCLRSAGYDVIEAGTGGEAIALATEHRPDIILMDVGLPDMDGWEATTKLKADARTAAIPVVAVTAHALQDERERARKVGCDGFLTKPCLPPELLAEVERVLTAGVR